MPVNLIVQITTYCFLITSVANTFCKASLFELVLHWLELLLLRILRLLLDDLVLGPWYSLLRLITRFLCHFNYISFITERLTKYYFTCRLLRDALRVSQSWRHHFWDLCIFWIQPGLQRYLLCIESCGYVLAQSSSGISLTSCGALYARIWSLRVFSSLLGLYEYSISSKFRQTLPFRSHLALIAQDSQLWAY